MRLHLGLFACALSVAHVVGGLHLQLRLLAQLISLQLGSFGLLLELLLGLELLRVSLQAHLLHQQGRIGLRLLCRGLARVLEELAHVLVAGRAHDAGLGVEDVHRVGHADLQALQLHLAHAGQECELLRPVAHAQAHADLQVVALDPGARVHRHPFPAQSHQFGLA